MPVSDALKHFIEDKHQFKIVDNSTIPYKAAVLREYDSLEKVWYVEYYIFDEKAEKLKRRRVTLSQDSASARRREAKIIIKELNEVLRAGAVINPLNEASEPFTDIPTNISAKSYLIDAIKYFLDYNKTVLRPRTLEVYTTDLVRFRKYLLQNGFAKLKLRDFNIERAIHFLDQIKISGKISNRSVNNNKDTCSTLFNFFLKRKIIDYNPFKEIKDLPSVAKRHTAFTNKQASDFKKECIKQDEHQLLLFVHFIYFMALRPLHEARLLKVSDIKEKTVLVRSENAKDKTTEHVRIPSAFQKILENSGIRKAPEHFFVFGKDGKPSKEEVSRKHFYAKHVRILEKLGLTKQNLDSYSWKHTGVIALWQATQNIELIRQHCRHSDIATTQKYLRDLGQFIDYEQIDKFPDF